MRETHSLRFAPFRLDLGAERLWRGEEARPLTRKAFAVLCYLVDAPGGWSPKTNSWRRCGPCPMSVIWLWRRAFAKSVEPSMSKRRHPGSWKRCEDGAIDSVPL